MGQALDKKKIIRLSLYVLFFLILAVAVCVSAIMIKYKILDFEVASKEPKSRDYSIYYNSLSYKDQLLYDSITAAAESMEEESETLNYSYTMEDFQRVLQCITGDRPDLFYPDFDELVLYHSNHKTKVGMVYLCDKKEAKALIDQYSDAVEKAMGYILPSMTDFEKEIAINDYITNNCQYAIGSESIFSATAYGALVEGKAFCDGYAYAAKQLFNESYIDSAVVYGSTDGIEHVWNMVELEGNFYHLDIMWNDADLNTDVPLCFHGYFNLSDKDISLDHSFENEDGVLPKAPVTMNYYKETNNYCSKLEELEELFYNSLLKAVEENRGYIELLCPESKNNEDLGSYYTKALRAVNETLGYEALYAAFSVYDASSQNNSVTIQIFYN